MVSDDKLSQLRSGLDSINSNLILLLNKRQLIVNEIQTLKKENKVNSLWCPQRELSVFKSYINENPVMDLRYVLMYSLLIEKQAQESGDYPTWSSQAHLEVTGNSIQHLINPILLFCYCKKDFFQLKLKTQFLDQLKGIIENG